MSDTKTEAQRSSLEVAQEHALILTQALPWVKALAGKTIVIKYGGAAMVDETLRASVMEDIMLMKLIGCIINDSLINLAILIFNKLLGLTTR